VLVVAAVTSDSVRGVRFALPCAQLPGTQTEGGYHRDGRRFHGRRPKSRPSNKAQQQTEAQQQNLNSFKVCDILIRAATRSDRRPVFLFLRWQTFGRTAGQSVPAALTVLFCALLLFEVVLPDRILPQADNITGQPQEIIDFLNKTIAWYQGEIANTQIAVTPSDRFFFDSNRAMADQIAHLSFEFARHTAELANSGKQSAGGNLSSLQLRYPELVHGTQDLATANQRKKAELASLREKLRKARAGQRKTIEAAISDAQSDLKLIQARQETFNNLLQFIQGGAANPESQQAQIDALERTIPSAQPSPSGATTASPAQAPVNRGMFFGIWGIVRRLSAASKKLQAINNSIRETNRLSENVEQLFGPLRKEMNDLVKSNESTSVQQAQPSLAQEQIQLDASANRFKQLAAIALPLSKQGLLLRTYSKNLQDWRAAARAEDSSILKSLIIRLLILGAVLAIVVGLFAIWRRTIVHYVGDLRRRYQLLVFRRIAFTFVIMLIIVSSFVSAAGSLATYAGLLTAGVAVALQNAIIAVVGYFMLIGRFGVSAGDRVQIADVVGEVAEIGMLRIFILELTGKDPDAQPTGRMVAFSNAVVFQLNAGLFKQVPGASLAWQEIVLTFAPEGNYRSVEQRIFAAVENVFKQYEGRLDRVRLKMQSNLSSVSIRSFEPQVRFQIMQTGIKVWIRFPVELQHAADLDDRIAKELAFAVEQEPKLKIVEAEGPSIRRGLDISNSWPAVSDEKSAKHSVS
jgi:hypothetical protein